MALSHFLWLISILVFTWSLILPPTSELNTYIHGDISDDIPTNNLILLLILLFSYKKFWPVKILKLCSGNRTPAITTTSLK